MPSAQSQIAGERKQSRWDRARHSILLPIGVIVGVAIVCIVVAVLGSAQRADEVSLNRDQDLIRLAFSVRGSHIMREVESIAATPAATASLRNSYDPQWADMRVGKISGAVGAFGKLKPADKVTPAHLPKPDVMHRRATRWAPWRSSCPPSRQRRCSTWRAEFQLA